MPSINNRVFVTADISFEINLSKHWRIFLLKKKIWLKYMVLILIFPVNVLTKV